MGKTSAIVVSDLHVNSIAGLCPPSVNIGEGGTYVYNDTQRALWKAWLDFWQTIADREVFEGRKVLILNGDLADIDPKLRTTALITRNNADIMEMTLNVLQPALDVVDNIIVVRGTEAHTGKDAWLEEAIAKDLDNVIENGVKASWWHFRGMTEGVRFDIAHHASMGRLPHTEKNAANKIAAHILYRYCVNKKQKPPNVAVRSHNHRYADSGGNYETFAVCTPCWQGPTAFVNRIGQENSDADIGGLVFVCEDGEYEYYPTIYRPKGARAQVWKVKF